MGLALAACLTAPAGALAGTWLAPATLSPIYTNADFFSADVAMDARGDAVASWRATEASGSFVYASYRPAGGPWGAVQTISANGATNPVNAIDDAGRAFVAWTQAGVVQLAVSTTAGAFGAPVPVSLGGAGTPRLAVRPDGEAVIAWIRSNVVEYLTRRADGTFSPPAGAQPLSAAGASALQVGIGAAGDVAAVWERAGGIEAVYRKAGDAAFGSVETLAPAAANVSYDTPRVAVDTGGRVTAVWEKTDANAGVVYSLQTAGRTRTIPFGTGVAFTTTGADIAVPGELGVDANGAVYATWFHATAGGTRIEAATKPQNGSFGAVQLVSASDGSADTPEVDVNPKGDVAITWNRYVPAIGTRLIETKYRPAGQTFDAQPVLVVSSEADHSDYPDVALDDAGNAIVSHLRVPKGFSPATYSLEAVGFDAVAPTLSDVVVPATAATGSAASLSAKAFDEWSAPAIAWDFGDGTTGAGGAVTHTFAKSGSYTVTVKATDATGQAASTTRTIQVSDAPVVPGVGGSGGSGSPVVPPARAAVLGSTFASAFRAAKTRTTVTKLQVKALPAGTTVVVSCKGKGCPAVTKRFTITKATTTLDVAGVFRPRKRVKGKLRVVPRKLGSGAVITIVATRPAMIGRRFTATMRKDRKKPVLAQGCLAPGSSTAASAC